MKSFGVWNALFLILLSTIGCTSASKLLQKGRYDAAIEKSAGILHKTPSDEKHLDILKTAYRLAYLNDDERLAELKKSGEPDIWAQVVTIYERMIERNKRVEALPSSVKNTIEFSYRSYNDELAVAKKKAADYYYALGTQKLETGVRIDARSAYADFEKVIQYGGTNFNDVEKRKNDARKLGTAYVLYNMENNSGRHLPFQAALNLEDIHPEFLNSFWVKYASVNEENGTSASAANSPQYQATFMFERYVQSPVAIKTKQNSYSKTITDGTEYLTDSKGKPMLDSAGNFIKIPKKITLRCHVVEVVQQKEIHVSGSLVYYDVENNRRMRTFPLVHNIVVGNSVFDVKGDIRALSNDVRNRIKAPVLPLPPDEELLILATADLGEKIRLTMKEYAWALK